MHNKCGICDGFKFQSDITLIYVNNGKKNCPEYCLVVVLVLSFKFPKLTSTLYANKNFETPLKSWCECFRQIFYYCYFCVDQKSCFFFSLYILVASFGIFRYWDLLVIGSFLTQFNTSYRYKLIQLTRGRSDLNVLCSVKMCFHQLSMAIF